MGNRRLIELLVCAACIGATSLSSPAAEPDATPQSFVTEHTARIGGRDLKYTAVAGTTILNDSKGTPAASIFSFSYIARDKATARPVIFVFNGGPGSSSIWTHFGMLGPRQVHLPDPIHPPTTAPFAIIDSPKSLLAVADLVFIDPAGTGFSRLLAGGRSEDFLGVTQDARATADFMQAWLTEHRRWNSPKYLLGESYGTVRAIMTTLALMGGVTDLTGQLRGISLNGIIILGPAFELGPPAVPGDDREFLNGLPSMASTAWVHDRLKSKLSLEQAVGAAQSFAAGEYLQALYAGNRLPAAQKEQIAARLEQISGVSAEAWKAADLRMSLRDFGGLILRDQGLRVGAYDSRYTLPIAAEGPDAVADDAAMGQYTPAFTGAFNDYVQGELNVRTTLPYLAIDWKNVFFRWDRGAGAGVMQPKNYGADLATAMRRNPTLKVFVAAGYFDLVTTYGAADYVLAHSAVPRQRVTLRGYPSGHMPYLGEESASALSADLTEFIAATAASDQGKGN